MACINFILPHALNLEPAIGELISIIANNRRRSTFSAMICQILSDELDIGSIHGFLPKAIDGGALTITTHNVLHARKLLPIRQDRMIVKASDGGGESLCATP